MKQPDISILLPHFREPNNDAALRICLDCIVAYTDLDYELIVESAYDPGRELYALFNEMTARAKAEYVLQLNSDMFLAPNWIAPMWEARNPYTIITGVLVECGAIGVNPNNVTRNFGMTPDKFDRAAFEAYAASGDEMPAGAGWYMPSLHHRATFLDMGGFDTSKGYFPVHPLDSIYRETWVASGRHVQRVRSYCYHLQNYSNPEEQTKAVRH